MTCIDTMEPSSCDVGPEPHVLLFKREKDYQLKYESFQFRMRVPALSYISNISLTTALYFC
jgi:hypothetical protein